MKTKLVLALVLSAAFAQSAFAQYRTYDPYRQDYRNDGYIDRNYNDRYYGDPRYNSDRARYEEQQRLYEQRRQATRSPYGPTQTAIPGEGAGPNRNIRLGDPIPPQYYNDRFVVEDWAARGLSQPAGNFKWFQVGNDYVQVHLINGLVGMVVVSR
jgi:Ni/Co efflux regulator RcnB